jgi:hypothetical protein
MQWLELNPDKINWLHLSMNPAIFKSYYNWIWRICIKIMFSYFLDNRENPLPNQFLY